MMSHTFSHFVRSNSPPASWQPIKLPDLGAGEHALRVSTWLTELGEEVIAGDAIVEVLLRGVTCDVEAPVTGILRRSDFAEEDIVTPGDVLGWIEPTENDSP